MRLPLADIRVIAIEQFGAGPWATQQLADLGADVIKIEDPQAGGDIGRYVPPYQEGEHSLFFETFNAGKRSITLDLRHEEGMSVFHELVSRADAVFSNLRGDGPAKLGLTYDRLKERNPAIVCVSLSGFGTTGPRAAEAGYDYTIQALAGWMSLTGDPDGPPTKSGLSMVDFSAGYAAAIALLAGVHRARRDGLGCDADVSLFETALHQLVYVGTWAASRGHVPERRPDSAHPSIVPFQLFATADGWIAVACAKEKFWRRLCQMLGRHDLLADPRYRDFAGRDQHRDSLLATLREIFAARPTDAWEQVLGRASVPHGRVNDVGDALADRQVDARELIVEVEHPVLGGVRRIASPLRLSGERREAARAPMLGEHTDEVLEQLCELAPERIRSLRDSGVTGPPAEDAALASREE